MNRMSLAANGMLLALGAALHAQTITAVNGEDGAKFGLCPGGIAFVQGSNLGGAGATVTVAGKRAFVLNGGATFLQVELPVDAPLGATTLSVGGSAPFNINLVQYAPGVPTDGKPDALVGAYHYPAQTRVTFAFPASPGEQIALMATGLGPTSVPVATGASPADNSATTTTLPTVNLAGKPATVSAAFLSPTDGPGFYLVVFTVPAATPNGNQNINVSIGGLTSGTAILPVASGPIVSNVTNAASYIDPSLPNGPIAQGSIFIVQGNHMGPAALTVAPNAFQSASLAGTSASVTVNGTTVSPLMYYTSTGQVAALLPSNTPVGDGTLTLSYNGQPGPSHPIRVVASNPGIFTVTSDGQGAGVVTYPDYSLVSTTKAANCGGPNTTCGAANPGDVLIVWATGLGPVSGSDAAGAGLGVNMSSLPLTVWLGGVQVTAAYQGRSGCCIGEDQVVFTVPSNAPTGCAVPLSIQVGSVISNNVMLPVAAAGARTCTPVVQFLSTDDVVALSNPGTFTFGGIDLKRLDRTPTFRDVIEAQFIRFSVPAASQPFFVTYVDNPAVGTCQVFNNPNAGINPPMTILGGLDAGTLMVQGPNGSQNAPGGGGNYQAVLSGTGSFFSAGPLTVSATGGKDVPAFSASLQVPAMPVMTSPQPDAAARFPVSRSSGLTVTWTGGLPNQYISLLGYNSTDNSGTVGASFQCVAAAVDGTFTIPPSVLMALPPGNFGGLAFHATLAPVNLTGTGLSASYLSLFYGLAANLSFQ